MYFHLQDIKPINVSTGYIKLFRLECWAAESAVLHCTEACVRQVLFPQYPDQISATRCY